MPLTSSLFHPRMMAELHLHQPQTVVIWSLTAATADPLGHIKRRWPEDYSVLAGHEEIKGTLSAESGAKGAFQEKREADSVYSSKTKFCLLDGPYPSIRADMVAVIDGVAFNIQGANTNTTGAVTRLAVEVIE